MRRSVMFLLGALWFFSAGCDPYECSTTSASTSRCGSIKACCTATQCEYRTGTGRTFACAGTDCSSTARQVVSACN